MNTKMLETYENITRVMNNKHVIRDQKFLVTQDCKNDYHHDQLPIIPAGTTIVAEFAGDFGIYAIADIGGTLHKIKIKLDEIHKINFRDFDAR